MELNLVEVCKRAVAKSKICDSDLPEAILNIEGMSSARVRHLLANITLGTRTYVEVGTWKGSTFLSAVYNKNIEAIGIDNWSQFNGPKSEFQSNLWTHRNYLPTSLRIIEDDFHNVTLTKNYYDCMFYDGDHSEQSQYDAITRFKDFMTNEFIYIVDDYSWESVRTGTQRGFADNKLEVVWSEELPSATLNDPINYWNGVLVSVLRKPNVA